MKKYFSPKSLVILSLVIIFSLFLAVLVVNNFQSRISRTQAAPWNPLPPPGSGDNTWGWAWASTIGWISFNCSPDGSAPCGGIDYGVKINRDGLNNTGNFSGYAWSSNVGWISFNDAEIKDNVAYPGCGYPAGVCHSARYEYTDAGADRRVTGWAKILTLGDDGWIRFDHGQPNPATINIFSGDFSGYAWNEGSPANTGIGWISFNSANPGSGGGNYLVMSDVNATPTAANLSAPNWGIAETCEPMHQARGANLKWDFVDTDPNSYGTAYQVIVKRASDDSVVIDTGKCTAWQAPPSKCKIDPAACMGSGLAPCNALGDCVCSYPIDDTELAYGTAYKWEVVVWDNFDTPSDTSTYNSAADTCQGNLCDDGVNNTFTTYAHEFPIVKQPAYFPEWPSASKDEEIMFFGTSSEIYLSGAPSTAIACGYDDTYCQWFWLASGTFKNGDNTTSTPIVIFNDLGDQDITLTITNITPVNVGGNFYNYTCTKIFPAAATTTYHLPSWIETK